MYGLDRRPVLYLADKNGLFGGLLDGGPMSSAALAERVDADADTVDRLLLVLAAAELRQRDGRGNYAVDAIAAPFVSQATRAISGDSSNIWSTAPLNCSAGSTAYLARGKNSSTTICGTL